jgi:hypothetical protein
MAEPEVLAVPSARAEPEAAPHVSLIVPIYNERASVDELYRARRDARGGRRSFEVIFVDDGSTDGRSPSSSGCTTPTRACAACASSATSASTRRCTPGSCARAARSS